MVLCGISSLFKLLSPIEGHVTHVLLTRSPLYSVPEGTFLARLACVKHAASVRSEPGSNSPLGILLARRLKKYLVALRRRANSSTNTRVDHRFI